MKQILLTGIGNALVDIEYSISDSELAEFGVEKGSMTLTDVARQREILQVLQGKVARKSSGGSAANTIIAFAQFGGSAGYSSLLGNDDMGRFYADEFRELGISLDARLVEHADTGSCIVLITPDSERTMNTTLAVNTEFSRENVSEDLIKQSEWLYIEGYKLTDEQGADSVEIAAYYAKKHDTKVAVTCSDKFIVDVFGDRLRSILKSADLVICNEREGCALAGEETIEDSYAKLKSAHKNLVFTKGDQGSKIYWMGTEANIPAYAATPVDATGAGDMYAGAFLYGALHKYSADHAGRLASYAAAKVVSQFGARLKASHIEVRDSVLMDSETL